MQQQQQQKQQQQQHEYSSMQACVAAADRIVLPAVDMCLVCKY
jgi:hypothetical protein